MSCELYSFVDELEIINDIKFTLKEIDVISALINGKSIKSIAALLNLSPKTVETHLRNIKQKLNCSSKETREAWQMVKDKVSECEPELASCMVRECVYRGFCPEMFTCGYYKTGAYKTELEEYRKGINP